MRPLLSVLLLATLLIAQPQGYTSVTLTDRSLTPRVLQVRTGQWVRLSVQNRGRRTHNLAFPDFSLISQPIGPGSSTTLEFRANRPGRFRFFSDYPNRPGVAEPGLSGTLIVR